MSSWIAGGRMGRGEGRVWVSSTFAFNRHAPEWGKNEWREESECMHGGADTLSNQCAWMHPDPRFRDARVVLRGLIGGQQKRGTQGGCVESVFAKHAWARRHRRECQRGQFTLYALCEIICNITFNDRRVGACANICGNGWVGEYHGVAYDAKCNFSASNDGRWNYHH